VHQNVDQISLKVLREIKPILYRYEHFFTQKAIFIIYLTKNLNPSTREEKQNKM